jgi:aerobic carbon-monoxide dehydrogenase small subunit
VSSNIELEVNGVPRRVQVEETTLLLDALRRDAGVTSAREGCGVGACGACTVLVDGRSTKSCTLLAAQAVETEVTTIEGLASEDGQRLSALQAAFHEHHALQCGYCTPGMIMAACSLLDELGDAPTDAEIRTGLKGNLCRCTGYEHIIDAIQAASSARGARPAAAGGRGGGQARPAEAEVGGAGQARPAEAESPDGGGGGGAAGEGEAR